MLKQKIKVFLADDTLIAREGWRGIIGVTQDIQVVGEAETALEILRKVGESKPDVLLMDLHWTGDDDVGWQTIRELRQNYPGLRIIAMTAYEHLISSARKAGADYGLTKNFTKDQLLSVIRELAARTEVLGYWPQSDESQPVEELTVREKAVLKLLIKGYENRIIAKELNIAESTVKHHVRSILSKFGVANRTEAANRARQLGLD